MSYSLAVELAALRLKSRVVIELEYLGSYQGEWIAVLQSDTYPFQYCAIIGSYGSCSFCDYMESIEGDYEEFIKYSGGLEPLGNKWYDSFSDLKARLLANNPQDFWHTYDLVDHLNNYTDEKGWVQKIERSN